MPSILGANMSSIVVILEAYRYIGCMTPSSPTPPDLVPATPASPAVISDRLRKLIEDAERYAAMATAPNTDRAFRSDWRDFEAWCAAESLIAYPADPSTVALYITALAPSHKVSTLQRRLTAINYHHRQRADKRPYDPGSLKHAAVANVMAGLKREKGVRAEAKAPVTTDQL